MNSISLAAVLAALLIGAMLSFGGAYLQSFLKSRQLRRVRERQAEPREHEPARPTPPSRPPAYPDVVYDRGFGDFGSRREFSKGWGSRTLEGRQGEAEEWGRLERPGSTPQTPREVFLSRLRGELTQESFQYAQQYLNALEKQLNELKATHGEEVERLKASMDARFNLLSEGFDARMDAFERRNATAQAAGERYSFWLTCSSNFVVFILGNVICIATTLVLG